MKNLEKAFGLSPADLAEQEALDKRVAKVRKDVGLTKKISGKEVLRRMKWGIFPVSPGGYSYSAIFPNGDKVSHGVMLRLLRSGQISRPEGTNCDAPWLLGDGFGGRLK